MEQNVGGSHSSVMDKFQRTFKDLRARSTPNTSEKTLDELFAVSSFKRKGHVFPLKGVKKHLHGKSSILFNLPCRDSSLWILQCPYLVQRSFQRRISSGNM
ncbi:hypothetical protein DAPPUDRAFT_253006 [Daphnia pulex]|uniref:Uncharacterized protein n=1 Tax=Daphnia pulex TaxID=6669 RepID=E9H3Z9_DAPPU|nr:hypothetical protein DAPPUDRAFT_253006 [Daphnia pulex]|eukprot:EFX73615.1 hypothetical protein DAPPUDRAFT_253006 [Daphnia pulex]